MVYSQPLTPVEYLLRYTYPNTETINSDKSTSEWISPITTSLLQIDVAQHCRSVLHYDINPHPAVPTTL